MMTLEKLGFSEWFQDRLEERQPAGRTIARVLSAIRDNYDIQDDRRTMRAEVSGRLFYKAESPLDLPSVGDWVIAQYFERDSLAIIHEVLPRRSVLKRKTAGKKTAFQLIAANIDTAFVVQSLDDNFNVRRLERYLVMIHDGFIEPFLLLSKSDLQRPAAVAERIGEIHAILPNLPVLAFSSKTKAGFDELRQVVAPAKTYCLLGSSGVGKTTLINELLEASLFATRPVREKDRKGRHTTASRQLVFLKNNAMVIDTPGMRELGNIGVEAGLERAFDDIETLAAACPFRNCSHVNESGCAVLAALREGSLPEDRYRNYLRIARESAFNEMSYLEKRKKDRAFGKMCKSVMKSKKNRSF